MIIINKLYINIISKEDVIKQHNYAIVNNECLFITSLCFLF